MTVYLKGLLLVLYVYNIVSLSFPWGDVLPPSISSQNYVYSFSPLVFCTDLGQATLSGVLLIFACLVGGNNARGKSINQYGF